MVSVIEDIDLEHELIQLLAKEVVRASMDSPLRDPILEAVEESTGESVETADEGQTADDTTNASGESRLTKTVWGVTVIVAMVAVLYAIFRQLTGDDAN